MATPEFDLAGAMALRRGRSVVGDVAFGGRQVRLTTAVLRVDRAEPIPVDRLSEALWPAGPPKRFRPALRGLVSKVRGLLANIGVAGECIQSRPGRYIVDVPDLQVDVEHAGAALRQARKALRNGALADAGAGVKHGLQDRMLGPLVVPSSKN